MNRIVLAYAGGLDTSVAVPWLAEKYRAEVVSVTLDLGQGRELESVRELALAAGAVRAHVIDAREEFADQYLLPALQAGALHDGRDPLAAALGRPLIAKKLVEIARIEGTDTIAHGCPGEGPDRMRIERPARALMPAVRIIAPAREWGLTHAEKVVYARERGVPAAARADAAHGTQANLWGRSVPCGAPDDPWVEPPAGVYALTKHPADCPGAPAYLEIEFEAGVPKAVNGVAMSFADIVASVGTIAAAHGVGRIDAVACGAGGALSRVVHEAPAAVVLHAALRELEGVFSPRDLLRVKQDLAVEYAAMVYDGGWHSPLRGAMDAFVAAMQQPVTGTVRTRLFKGSAQVVGRTRGPAQRPALLEKAV